MDRVALLSAADRADLFRASADRRGLNPAIIEKDFWVCWTLQHLFALGGIAPGLIFKGGTSLSKVFKAIERFSEDIDLSFDRHALGFTGDADPQTSSTGKQRRRNLDALSDMCRQLVQDKVRPALAANIGQALAKQDWSLAAAADDPDQQTLVFVYPQTLAGSSDDEPAYIRPSVRLEFGARSDHWPAQDATISPYAAEDFPQAFTNPVCPVHVLSAERTFWEKATVLHTWYHAPADKPLRDRQSRHYYDVVRLFDGGIGEMAIGDTDLLIAVAQHKKVFFPSAWARYDEARPGTLHLVPPDGRISELRRDYQTMQEMIFGNAPAFNYILTRLGQIEALINNRGNSV